MDGRVQVADSVSTIRTREKLQGDTKRANPALIFGQETRISMILLVVKRSGEGTTDLIKHAAADWPAVSHWRLLRGESSYSVTKTLYIPYNSIDSKRTKITKQTVGIVQCMNFSTDLITP